jgi:rubredoxin
MLSSTIKCPHCGDVKDDIDELLSPSALEETVIHFFCIGCGHGYQVTESEGQYLLEDVHVEG